MLDATWRSWDRLIAGLGSEPGACRAARPVRRVVCAEVRRPPFGAAFKGRAAHQMVRFFRTLTLSANVMLTVTREQNISKLMSLPGFTRAVYWEIGNSGELTTPSV